MFCVRRLSREINSLHNPSIMCNFTNKSRVYGDCNCINKCIGCSPAMLAMPIPDKLLSYDKTPFTFTDLDTTTQYWCTHMAGPMRALKDIVIFKNGILEKDLNKSIVIS